MLRFVLMRETFAQYCLEVVGFCSPVVAVSVEMSFFSTESYFHLAIMHCVTEESTSEGDAKENRIILSFHLSHSIFV